MCKNKHKVLTRQKPGQTETIVRLSNFVPSAKPATSCPLAERREYLRGVEEHRGIAGRKYLERVILSEWQKKAPTAGG